MNNNSAKYFYLFMNSSPLPPSLAGSVLPLFAKQRGVGVSLCDYKIDI
jgi:hypothetical protein